MGPENFHSQQIPAAAPRTSLENGCLKIFPAAREMIIFILVFLKCHNTQKYNLIPTLDSRRKVPVVFHWCPDVYQR